MTMLLVEDALAWMVKLPFARVTHSVLGLFKGVSTMILEVVAAGVVTVTEVLPAGRVA